MAAFLGLSVAAGLVALLPSKKEAEREVPWCSILLAMLSGTMAALFAATMN